MAIRQVPAPTWKQSGNNLLPQWMKFLEDHRRHFGKDELQNAKAALAQNTSYCELYTSRISKHTSQIDNLKGTLAKLQASQSNDAPDFTALYGQLTAHPSVVGVRTGAWGELVIAFQPNGDPSYGIYEFGGAAFSESSHFDFSFVGGSHFAYRVLSRNIRVTQDLVFQNNAFVKARLQQGGTLYEIKRALEALNFTEVVDILSNVIIDFKRYRDDSDASQLYTQPPSGYDVADPERALRLLYETIGVDTVQRRIGEIKMSIERFKRLVATNQDDLRTARRQVRKYRAQVAELEAAPESTKINAEEARELLAYITTIPGVMAIRFEEGLPVLHVRNSFVRGKKRYDLGDYEIRMRLNSVEPRIIRTRRPLGGDYTAGWNGGDYFCFGSRNSQVYQYYELGDFAHYMSLVIGTMNSISVSHEYLVTQNYFARIGIDDVPQRRLRTRPRHGKRREVTAAVA